MNGTARKLRKGHRPPVSAELQLLDWGPRGTVRSELDHQSLLVDRGIPGECVTATVLQHRRPWRAVVSDVVEPSSHRVPPLCPYFSKDCGGCQWQHVSYEFQLNAKRELVHRELAATGVAARVSAVHSMAEPWRYRHTAAIALGWEAGFRPRGRRGIVEIHDCLISHPLIGQLAHDLNTLLVEHRMPNYHGKVWLDCTVVGSQQKPRLQVLLQGISGLTLETHPELHDVASIVCSLPYVCSVAFRHRAGDPRPLVGDLTADIEVGTSKLLVPVGSFFQTNLQMLSILIDRMLSAVEGESVGNVADVYGGVGTFGLVLAPLATQVTLIELDSLAVAAARQTAGARGLANCTFVDRHAERALPELPPFDLVVVDPPRSGLGAKMIDAIAANGPGKILYVSCAPPSLASDLALLSDSGYRVTLLEIFDFYPQTYHVESLAVLKR